jgi:hypothetical protein
VLLGLDEIGDRLLLLLERLWIRLVPSSSPSC